MPVIEVTGTSLWLPDHTMLARIEAENLWPQFKEARVTHDLLRALPAICIEIVNRVDGTKLTVNRTRVVPRTLHIWAQHMPDLAITVQTGANRNPTRERIIAEHLAQLLSVFFEATPISPDRPRLKIDVRPFASTGLDINAGGIVTNRWGDTDQHVETIGDRFAASGYESE